MTNNIFKALLLIAMMTASAMYGLAQTSVEFQYDANGNRILRQIVIGGNKEGLSKNTSDATTTDSFESLSIALYPNPTEGRFAITLDGEKPDVMLYATLTTYTGSIIYDKRIVKGREDFDLTSYPKGVYLLRLTIDSESHVWKVIKK